MGELTLCLEIAEMRSEMKHLEKKHNTKSLGVFSVCSAWRDIILPTCSVAAGGVGGGEEGEEACCTSSVCSSSSSPACWGSWEDIPEPDLKCWALVSLPVYGVQCTVYGDLIST